MQEIYPNVNVDAEGVHIESRIIPPATFMKALMAIHAYIAVKELNKLHDEWRYIATMTANYPGRMPGINTIELRNNDPRFLKHLEFISYAIDPEGNQVRINDRLNYANSLDIQAYFDDSGHIKISSKLNCITDMSYTGISTSKYLTEFANIFMKHKYGEHRANVARIGAYTKKSPQNLFRLLDKDNGDVSNKIRYTADDIGKVSASVMYWALTYDLPYGKVPKCIGHMSVDFVKYNRHDIEKLIHRDIINLTYHDDMEFYANILFRNEWMPSRVLTVYSMQEIRDMYQRETGMVIMDANRPYFMPDSSSRIANEIGQYIADAMMLKLTYNESITVAGKELHMRSVTNRKSLRKIFEDAKYNHRIERYYINKNTKGPQLCDFKLPTELEKYRIKTKARMVNLGKQCGHCIGSKAGQTASAFLNRGTVCAEIRPGPDGRLERVQCYDRKNRVTGKSMRFGMLIDEKLGNLTVF